MKMEVDFRMDLTETEADMLHNMILIYYEVIRVHSNDSTGLGEKFCVTDRNEFYSLVNKLSEITGRSFDYV